MGILMDTNCAPLVADLFLFCYESDFVLSLSGDNQSDVIEAFTSIFRNLDGLLGMAVASLVAWSAVSALRSFG